MKSVLTRSLEFASKNVMYVFLGVLVGLGLLSFAIESLKKKESSNPICSALETLCGTTCKNLKSDKDNCGTCRYKCWDQFAINSECQADNCVCPYDFPTFCGAVNLGDSPYCVNTDTDVNNCGGCNIICPAGESCTIGICG